MPSVFIKRYSGPALCRFGLSEQQDLGRDFAQRIARVSDAPSHWQQPHLTVSDNLLTP
jgi:hypothetical protein